MDIELANIRFSDTLIRQAQDNDEFQSLVNSIKEHGVLQPIRVKPDHDNEGQHIVIYGHRRLRAAAMLELQTIPVIVDDVHRTGDHHADVMRRVSFVRTAQRVGLSLADGGMTLDMSRMRDVRVDRDRLLVRVGPGCLLGDVDRVTQEHGLATTGGRVSTTGVAGLTLGGGSGWLERAYGLACDNLLSVDVVTADGRLVTASKDENPDLFWGVRGGGGNFGIVTDFEFRLCPVGPYVVAGPVFWSMEDAPEVLRFYRDWLADCPDDLMTIAVQRRAPALPIVPVSVLGTAVLLWVFMGLALMPLDRGEGAFGRFSLAVLRGLGIY